MLNSTIDNQGLDWFDRDRVVQRVIIFGSPIPGTSVLHWRILLNMDFSGNQRSVLLDLNKGGADFRTGILLIKSVNYSTSQSAQISFPFGVPNGITVGRFIDLVLGLKRNRYRFDSTGSGCRYWCWVVLSDFERAGFVASGSSAFFLQAIAGLAQDNPARYPIPAPEGSFYEESLEVNGHMAEETTQPTTFLVPRPKMTEAGGHDYQTDSSCDRRPSPLRKRRSTLAPTASTIRLVFMDADFSKLRALIIGINHYPKLQRQLEGAVPDAQAFQDFVLNDLKVGQDHIVTLLDSSATRSVIISEIHKLKCNPLIDRGDPILIFYAGHGSLVKTSARQKKFGYEEIQVICPHDSDLNSSQSEGGNLIADIEIAALLNELAQEKGNNITVILDSCYSASGDRTDDLESKTDGLIARDAGFNENVVYHINNDIVSSLPLLNQGSANSRGPILLLCTYQASHVLLAASGSNEKAWEQSGKGLFTHALLATIRKCGVYNTTYDDVIMAMPQLGLNMRSQRPHCYGVHTSRMLFSKRVRQKPNFVSVQRIRDSLLLDAGEASGVTSGSEWELCCEPIETSQPIAHLRATKPNASKAGLLSIPGIDLPTLPLDNTRVYARQIQHGPGHELRVYFSPQASSLIFPSGYDTAARHVGSGSPGGVGYIVHKTLDGADLAVGIDQSPSISTLHSGTSANAVFTLLDENLKARQYGVQILNQCVPARKADVERVLFAAAQWHWHLKRRGGPSSCSDTSLELLKLGTDHEGYCVASEKMENLVNPQGVAEITVREEDCYGIRILNKCNAELYVRAFYFAARDFSIKDIFGHKKAAGYADPDVPKRGQRVIGDGADGGGQLSFQMNSGEVLELGFIKVFWSTKPLHLDHVEQDSPFDGSFMEGRGLVLKDSEKWGAECIVLVQRAC